MSTRTLQELESARKIFQEHGGAIDTYHHHGKVCAVGALMMAVYGKAASQLENFPPFGSGSLDQLQQSASELFDRTIIQVNDVLGRQAVLDTYDHAIKNIKESVVTDG